MLALSWTVCDHSKPETGHLQHQSESHGNLLHYLMTGKNVQAGVRVCVNLTAVYLPVEVPDIIYRVVNVHIQPITKKLV